MQGSRTLVTLIALVSLAMACAPTALLAPTASPPPTATLTPPPSPTDEPIPTPTPAPTSTAELASPTPAEASRAFGRVMDVSDIVPGEFRRFHRTDDTVWLVTDAGFAQLDDGVWRASVNDVPGTPVGVDGANRPWVVSPDTKTISAWNSSSWTTYADETGWLPVASDDEPCHDGWMQPDGGGRLWLTTCRDVRAFDGDRWTVYSPADMGMAEVGPQESWATFTLEVAGSGVWVGTCDWGGPGPVGGQGVRWFDGETWRGADSPVAAGCATDIVESNQGQVWIALDNRLWRHSPDTGEWTDLPPPEPPIADMRFGFADALTLDPSGNVWPAMVLCGGASCYGSIVLYEVDGAEWTQIGEPLDFGGGIPAPQVLADGTGARWLSWAGSLYRLRDDVPESVPNLGFVRDIVVDGTGRVWLAVEDQGRSVLWAQSAERGQ